LEQFLQGTAAALAGVGIVGGGVVAHGTYCINKAEGHLDEMKNSALTVYNALKGNDGLLELTENYINQLCNLIKEKQAFKEIEESLKSNNLLDINQNERGI